MHQLVQLIYVSRATAMDESAQCRMLKQARFDNARRHLTGMLVRLGNIYIQELEGEPGMVEAVFQTIARDTRHTEVKRLLVRPLSERWFPAWHLGCSQVALSDSIEFLNPLRLPTCIDSVNVGIAERLLMEARRATGAGKLVIGRSRSERDPVSATVRPRRLHRYASDSFDVAPAESVHG
jgi:hypothetical protein